MNLTDKHVVITGGSRGIGAALADECARRGARVTTCARTATKATAADRQTMRCDITDSESVAAFVRAAVDAHGPIDVLVNNAGLLGPKATLVDYPLDAWRQVFDVNATGTFLMTKAALPHMASGGLLAHVSSWLGRNAIERYGAYCASKFAVEGLARLVAEEHPELISIAIDPGMVQTQMLKAAQESDDVSGNPTPAEAAVAFANCLERATSSDSGQTLSL